MSHPPAPNPARGDPMAYVVSATWTAQPGKEDVVLDAIEKLTPPSREEPGNRFYQAYQDPAEPVGLPPLRDLRRRGGLRRARRVGPLQGSTRSSRPSRCWPTASAPSTRRSADPVRLAAFRRPTTRSAPRRVGSSSGTVRTWWVHPFHDGTDLVELLAADAGGREEAADVAAQSDGLHVRRGRPAAAGLPGRDARLPHLRGARRRDGARPRQPRRARRSGTPPRSSCSWRRTR